PTRGSGRDNRATLADMRPRWAAGATLAAMSDDALRVAILAPISWRVPPRQYGPWEQFASLLTEGLVERGVDVTLFATADSMTTARLDAVCPRPLMEDPTLDAKVWEA